MELKDLSPQKDPKGGSPRTPSVAIPLKTYQQYTNGNGNGTIWKVATSFLGGMCVSLVVAYFTALRGQGLSQKDMQDYVDRAFSNDRAIAAMQNATQDEKIGSLLGSRDRIFTEIEMLKQKHIGYDNSITEMNGKIKYFADYVEEQRKAKR
jgi:hypothetical protein